MTGLKVMLMIEELLNISPEFREWFRKESTPRRVSIKEMEKERKVAMNAKIQIEEPCTSESKIEEVFIQEGHLEEILKGIPNVSNLTNHVKSTAPKEVDAFGKDILYPTITRHIYGVCGQDKNMSNSLLLKNLMLYSQL